MGGWILAGIGGLLVLLAVALVVVHLTQRDNNGYFTSSTIRVAAPGYAVTSEALRIGNLPSFASDVLGKVRVSARSSNGQALFVGIAPQNAVNGYLAEVARSEVTDVNDSAVKYKQHPGGAPGGAPARQGFWQSASSGSSQVTTTWKVKGGSWAIVLMNANGTPDIRAAVRVGAKTNVLLLGRPRLPRRRTDRGGSERRDALEQPLTVSNGQRQLQGLARSFPEDCLRGRRRTGSCVALEQ